jgi:hypothetical protein
MKNKTTGKKELRIRKSPISEVPWTQPLKIFLINALSRSTAGITYNNYLDKKLMILVKKQLIQDFINTKSGSGYCGASSRRMRQSDGYCEVCERGRDEEEQNQVVVEYFD